MAAKRILHLVVIAGLVISCKKDPSSPVSGYSYLSSDLHPFMFATGSYWVYENDSTGALDSVSVIAVHHDFYWSTPAVHGQPGHKTEYYRIDVQSSYYSTTYNDYLSYEMIRRNGGGDYGQLGQPIFILAESGFNGLQVIADQDTLTVNSSLFHSIRITKVIAAEQYQVEFDHDTYFYYSTQAGLIKRVVDLGGGQLESWSLKRWNVLF